MGTKDQYTKSIRFSAETDEKLTRLALKFGCSKFRFFGKMVDYFHRTKKDPADISDAALRNALAKSHDTYVSFIKGQEKVLLIPMFASVERMVKNQEQIVRFFNEQVLEHNRTLLKAHKEQDKVLGELKAHLQDRSLLKSRFLQILEAYAKARESLGTFKGRDKEELLEQTRKQIKEL